MSWDIQYIKEAEEDFNSLDGSVKKQVIKAIEKVSTNPLPKNEGGYGIPLANHSRTKLAGFFKIKLKKTGIRIVYKTIREDEIMKIIIISIRENNIVYELAHQRIQKEKKHPK